MSAASPAHVAVSAGLNRIHAPRMDAAMVAVAVAPPAVWRALMNPSSETPRERE